MTALSWPQGALLSDVAAINAVPVLGDVYPHGNYWARLQQKLLQEFQPNKCWEILPIFFLFFFGGGQPTAHITCSQDTHKMLLNLSVPVLGWLDALDNGAGRQGARFLDFSPIARHHESNQSNLFDMFDGKLENTSAWCCPMHCSGGEWDIWMIRATQMAWATKPCSMPLTSQFLTRKTSKNMHDKFHSQKWVYIIAFTAGVAGL